MSDLKVMMVPSAARVSTHGASGIQTLVKKYFKYLPEFGIDLVDEKCDSFDLLAVHAGMTNQFPLGTPHVSHIHGLYWTADYDSFNWAHKANRNVINSLRLADTITVPSEWVAQNIRRDLRADAIVVRHGIDWDEWQGDYENSGYVLWNKNRDSDVCSAFPVSSLALRCPDVQFLSTFCENDPTPNVKKVGLVEHEIMKEYIKHAGVYLATTKETFGIGTLEAMSAGVPILGFNHGGTSTIVDHGVTGYLANPNDYDDLERGLRYCIEHREILGDNARQSAKGYDWPSVAEFLARDVYLKTYQEQEEVAVSVVIPCYNKAETLERAVTSALNQTLKPKYVIIVDNNSKDNSHRIAKELEGKHPNVWVVECPEQGVAHARNMGVQIAGTKYVSCLDADDEIAPDFLKVCVKALMGNPNLGLAYTKLEGVDTKGNRGVSAWPGEYDFDKFLMKQNQVPTCNVFRRDLWERLGGYRQRYAPHGAGAEDAEFWFRMGVMGYSGELVTEEPLFVYHFGGAVSGNPHYQEPDWLGWHPYVTSGEHPFASMATPRNKLAHPVRQYDMPSVSVVIPCSVPHLKHTVDVLDSLEAQTYYNWEAIVVVDGGEATDYYKKAYPHVKWLSQEHRGPGAARNLGVSHAVAPLLLFIDADDWLTPEALEYMIKAYDASPNTIIYTDYYAHSYMTPGAELQKVEMMGRLKHYDKDTNKAIMLHRASEFICDKAHAQPDPNDMYIWNLITCLTPKRFHDKIGGFDESMRSWEDWDYWLRMTHEGICFTWLEQPLVEYRFDTGTRRSLANPTESGEDGRQLGVDLIEYLRDKYEGKEKMACGGCRKHQALPTSRPAVPMANSLNAGSVNMAAGDMVWVELNDGNIGSHPISFGGTNYGYRASGERFKMIRAHADLDRRVVIVEQDLEMVPSIEPDPLPEAEPPPQYAEWAKEPEPEPEAPPAPKPTVIDDFQVMEAMLSPGEKAQAVLDADEPMPDPVPVYDLTRIWGITEEREALLQTMGVRSPQAIVELGEKVIAARLSVTETVSKRIIKSAADY
jgi:glycosyltransferase involved in cell wall biosynthesis